MICGNAVSEKKNPANLPIFAKDEQQLMWSATVAQATGDWSGVVGRRFFPVCLCFVPVCAPGSPDKVLFGAHRPARRVAMVS